MAVPAGYCDGFSDSDEYENDSEPKIYRINAQSSGPTQKTLISSEATAPISSKDNKISSSNDYNNELTENREKSVYAASSSPRGQDNCNNVTSQCGDGQNIFSKSALPDPVNLEDLRIAATNGNTDLIGRSLSTGFHVDSPLKSGWTMLMYACSTANENAARFLIERGADANFAHERFTPLMAVCSSKKRDSAIINQIVSVLLNHSAKVNAHDRYTMTPLHYAAKEGRADAVRSLIGHGADVTWKDSRGWTAVARAVANGHSDTVDVLLEAGASINPVDGEKLSDLAFSTGNPALAKKLAYIENPDLAAYTEPLCTSSPDGARKGKAQARTPGKDLTPPCTATPVSPASSIWASIRASPSSSNPVTEPTSSLTVATTKTPAPVPEMKISRPTLPNSSGGFVKFGDLELFLCGLELSHLVPLFQKEAITFPILLSMTDTDLEQIGVKQLGYRKTILDMAYHIHKTDWQKTSLPEEKKNRRYSCDEMCSILANIDNHIHHIHSTISYLNERTNRGSTALLKSVTVNASIDDLTRRTVGTLAELRNLYSDLSRLKSVFTQLGESESAKPDDLITGGGASRSTCSLKMASVVTVVGLSAIGCFLFYRHRTS